MTTIEDFLRDEITEAYENMDISEETILKFVRENYLPEYVFPDLNFTGFKDCDGNKLYIGDEIEGWKAEQGKKETKYKCIDKISKVLGGLKLFGRPMQSYFCDEEGHLKYALWRQPTCVKGGDIYFEITNIKLTNGRGAR